MSLAYQPLEGRRSPRDDVDFHCQTRFPSGLVHAHLVNISPLGCMIRSSAAVAPDDAVMLRLPILGSTTGQVVWAKLDRIGVEFARAIDPQAYAQMLPQLNPQARTSPYR